MDRLRDLGSLPIILNDLLDAPRGEGSVASRLEEVLIFRVGPQVAFQDQAEACREKDVPVFASFSLVDEDFARIEINIRHSDPDQFAHAHSGVKKELEHDFMLEIAAVLDRLEEALQLDGRHELRQLTFLFRSAQPEFSSDLLADVEKIRVIEPFLASQANDLGDRL